MRDAVKLINRSREKRIWIYYLPTLNWDRKATFELIGNAQLYIFPDDNFGTLRGRGSLQSYTSNIGRACSKRRQHMRRLLLEACAWRARRVCKSTHASGASALSMDADVGLRIGSFFIEMATDSFGKSIIQHKSSPRLRTPFSESPSANTSILELERNSLKTATGYELQSDSTRRAKLTNQLFDRSSKGGDIIHWCKMLLMADSANCYSPILSGPPPRTEKYVRVIFVFTRYLRRRCSYIHRTELQSYGPLAKGKEGIGLYFFSFLGGVFRIGFLGRVQMEIVKRNDLSNPHHHRRRKTSVKLLFVIILLFSLFY